MHATVLDDFLAQGPAPVALGALRGDQPLPVMRQRCSLTELERPAPDFVAPAYHRGREFWIRLRELQGLWVVLHFYIGDFTYV